MFYCYNSKCPIRTQKEPWPRSDGEFKYVKTISHISNKPYYRKLYVCVHCGQRMTNRYSGSMFDD